MKLLSLGFIIAVLICSTAYAAPIYFIENAVLLRLFLFTGEKAGPLN